MHYRFATQADVALLAWLNRQLIEDEGHRNISLSVTELEGRMRGFLRGDYTAVLFEERGHIVAYALYRDHPDHADTVQLRQLFVVRDRRRQGLGREAFRLLREEIWPQDKRVALGVLWHNAASRAFWEALGFAPYALELELPPPGEE